MKKLELGHIVSAGQFTKEQVMKIFNTALEMEAIFKSGRTTNILANRKGIGVLFTEASTGTRISIESAIDLLGGRIITSCYNTETALSIAKGENFTDTIWRICGQSPTLGALFIRHYQESAIDQAVKVADKYRVKIV